MTLVELEHWRAHFALHPFDDLHRFHRPAALLASLKSKDTAKGYKAAIDFLSPPPPDPNLAGYTPAQLSTFAAFGITPPPRPIKDD